MCKVSDKSENIFFMEKSACYPLGVWFFFSKNRPNFQLEVGFFSIYNFFLAKRLNTANLFIIHFLWAKIQIFFPPNFQLEVGFFSIYNFFRIIFPNRGTFILPKLNICRFEKKNREPFWIGRAGHYFFEKKRQLPIRNLNNFHGKKCLLPIRSLIFFSWKKRRLPIRKFEVGFFSV